MKSAVSIIGIILIILGVVSLSYQGFNYSTREEIIKIGDLKVTAQTEKHVELPPILGGLSLIIGVVLVLVDRFKKP